MLMPVEKGEQVADIATLWVFTSPFFSFGFTCFTLSRFAFASLAPTLVCLVTPSSEAFPVDEVRCAVISRATLRSETFVGRKPEVQDAV